MVPFLPALPGPHNPGCCNHGRGKGEKVLGPEATVQQPCQQTKAPCSDQKKRHGSGGAPQAAHGSQSYVSGPHDRSALQGMPPCADALEQCPQKGGRNQEFPRSGADHPDASQAPQQGQGQIGNSEPAEIGAADEQKKTKLGSGNQHIWHGSCIREEQEVAGCHFITHLFSR